VQSRRRPDDREPGTIGWFDFDCDYCTGIYDFPTRTGLFHKTWNASAPPPNPVLNVSVTYNFTDNPDRTYAPAGDNAVYLAWDNISETSPDPSDTHFFDFRGYKIWKVSDWSRPVGSPGPSETEWQLLGEFRLFDYRDNNAQPIPNNKYLKYNPANPAVPDTVCPKFYIPQLHDSLEICLNRGTLGSSEWSILRPETAVMLSYPTARSTAVARSESGPADPVPHAVSGRSVSLHRSRGQERLPVLLFGHRIRFDD
jgi:hypothetical protein